ncbi:MAG: ABC-2 transporter permease [Clostridia bacterium]|nr:ABC-2 transporter permease [Clostridia bacterium]
MFGLLYKDLLTHKKQLLSIVFVVGFFLGWTIVSPLADPDLNEWELDLVLAFSSIAVMLTIEMFEQGIFGADEMKKWQAFIASSADGIRRQIGAKYVFNAALSCIVSNILTIFFTAASAINGTDVNIAVMLLLQFLWLQLLIRAIETPFLIRFGSKQGNIFRMVLIGLLTMGVTIYGLFGDLSVFGSLESFLKWLNDYLTNSSSYIFYLTPAFTWIIYYISYKISCKLYLKGGAYYDK